METILSDEFYPEEGVPTGGVLAVTCFRLEDQWAALMYCQGHLQSTICGWPGNLFSWALPGHYRDIYSRQWMQYRNGWLGMVSSLQPTNAKSYILLHPDLGLRDPLQSGLATLFCQWRSQWNSWGCGGTRTSHSRSTSVCSQPLPSAFSIFVGSRQRHTSDAVPGHCSLQAGLWLHCVLHSVKHRSTTSGQHP